MSRRIGHKIWENPPYTFGCQPSNKRVTEEVVSGDKKH